MFGLFKKTSWKIEGKAFDFFYKLFIQLPSEFNFLIDGLQKGLYLKFSINHAMKGFHYSIGLDSSQSDKSMIKGKQFKLKDIFIVQDGQAFSLNLSIYEGLWVGFEIQKNILDFTNYQIDLSKYKKSKESSSIDNKIKQLVSGLSSDKLDLDNLDEIEIKGQSYFQIKDLEDGNYMAIDNKGQVFILIHDPFKIDLINESIRDFVSQVNSESFDFDKYLRER